MDIGDDKIAAQSRKYLQRFDIEDILFEFSRKAAKHTFHLAKPYMPNKEYKLVLRWLNTGDESLRDAARDAAGAAAWDAASAAARAAARDAAWDAAWAAARDAAGAAARDAAGAAAWDARDTEKEWQEKQLLKMITAKYGKIK
jgi:hypothetical protein